MSSSQMKQLQLPNSKEFQGECECIDVYKGIVRLHNACVACHHEHISKTKGIVKIGFRYMFMVRKEFQGECECIDV